MHSTTLLLISFIVTGSLAQITWDTATTATSNNPTVIIFPPRRNAPLFGRDPYRCQNGGDLFCCDYVGGRDNPCHNKKQASVPGECSYTACCLTKGHGYYCVDPKDQGAPTAQIPGPASAPASAPASSVPAPSAPVSSVPYVPPVVVPPAPTTDSIPQPPAPVPTTDSIPQPPAPAPTTDSVPQPPAPAPTTDSVPQPSAPAPTTDSIPQAPASTDSSQTGLSVGTVTGTISFIPAIPDPTPTASSSNGGGVVMGGVGRT